MGGAALLLAAACQPAAPTAAPAAGSNAGEAAKPAAPAAPPLAPAAGSLKRGGSLRIALDADCTTMDPHLSSAAVDRQIYQGIYNSLVRLDENLGVQPELAASWTAPDPKTYVFKLQQGVKFHDGTDFNAAAVKFNMERMKTHPKSLRKGEIAELESVEVVDDSTVRFNLSQPSSPLLATLTDRAGVMVSPKAAQEKGDDLARSPVGTGPFTFVEWIKDDHLTIRKNSNYWEKGTDGGPMPYLDEVVYRPIPDGTVAVTALRTGTVDVLDIPPAKDIATLKGLPELRTSEVPGLAFHYLRFNVSKPPFDNRALREAVGWSIDRELINKVVFFNLAVPNQTPIPPSSWAYDPNMKFWQRDVAKAKQKLVEGGKPDGFEFTVMLQNTPEFKQLYEVIQEQLRDVGITMNLEVIEFGLSNTRGNQGDYIAYGTQWSGRPDPDGNIYRYVHSKGDANPVKYYNPRVDELLDQTRAISDQAQRKALYAEVLKVLAEDTPILFLETRPEVKAMSQKVQGFVHVPDRMIRTKGLWLST
jgi:peptide/nickel transport system substrate-binding protein